MARACLSAPNTTAEWLAHGPISLQIILCFLLHTHCTTVYMSPKRKGEMSIFDVVDFNVTNRRIRQPNSVEGGPNLFGFRDTSDSAKVIEALNPVQARAPNQIESWYKNGMYERRGMIIVVCWVACLAGLMVPQISALLSAPKDIKNGKITLVAYDCKLSSVSLFVSFPCISVDVFCKSLVYVHRHPHAVIMYMMSLFGFVITTQMHCIPRVASFSSISTFVFFNTSLLVGIWAQHIFIKNMTHDANTQMHNFLMLASCILMLISWISVGVNIVGLEHADASQIITFQLSPLTCAFFLHACSTFSTLAPLYLVSTSLQT